MKNKKMWMVRAGESAKWIEDFAEHQVVAIGWNELGKVGARKGSVTNENDNESHFSPTLSTLLTTEATGCLCRHIRHLQKRSTAICKGPKYRAG